MKIKEVLSALEQFAPLPLQEGFDNAGLQVGLTETEVSGALLCLDVNETVVDEAVAKGCNLIVAHHPLIFHKLARVSDDDALHTNIDNARGGVNFKIAEKMELVDVDFFGERKTIQTLNDKGESICVEGASGVMGAFEEPLAADDFVLLLKKTFDVECVMCNQLLRRPIKKVAICGGAGAFLLPHAIAAGADAFVTGEMHYHDYFDHEQQIQIAVIGHYQSEQFTNEIFKTIIEERCKGVKCFLAQTNTNPIIYL